MALRAFSSQRIASSMRDCSRCACPIRTYQYADQRIARTKADGLLYQRDYLLYRPSEELARPRAANAPTQLRLNASAVSYSGMASSHRRCARSTWPFAKCASGLRGDAAKACRPTFRPRDVAADESVIQVQHAAHERARQPALRLDGARIERQRALEQANRLRIVLT